MGQFKDLYKVFYEKGKLPGLVANAEDSQSEPWSLDVSSIPGLPKTRWIKKTTLWHRRKKIIKTTKRGKSHQKKIFKEVK